MKCEICKINEATRAVTRKMDGENKELFVCDSCVRSAPASGNMPTSLTDVLFSFRLQAATGEKIESAVCDLCGMSRNDIREKHRLGCPKCYETFITDIRTFVSGQQFHVEEVDVFAEPGEREVEKLKRNLEHAVAEERYEDAAEIMSVIRKLTGSQKDKPESGNGG